MGISQSSLLYQDLPVIIVASIIALLFILGAVWACLFHPKSYGEKKGKEKGKSLAYPNTTHRRASPRLQDGQAELGEFRSHSGVAHESRGESSGPRREDRLIPNRLEDLVLDPFRDSASHDTPIPTPVSAAPQLPPQALTRSRLNLSDFDVDRPSSIHSFTSDLHTGARTEASGTTSVFESPYSPPPHSATTTADAEVPRSPTSTYDDGVSMKTSSTLPPSYRTRRSVLDLTAHSHSSPSLSDGVPRTPHIPPVPPSAYRRNRRGSRAGATLIADLQAAGWGRDTPTSRTEDEEGGGLGARQRRPGPTRERRRSKDGGVRLEGGRPGSPAYERDLGDDSGGSGSTRPPSYLEGE